MNGMLQHPDVYRDAADRRQQEARAWAEANALGQVATWGTRRYAEHPARARAATLAARIGVGLAILAAIL